MHHCIRIDLTLLAPPEGVFDLQSCITARPDRHARAHRHLAIVHSSSALESILLHIKNSTASSIYQSLRPLEARFHYTPFLDYAMATSMSVVDLSPKKSMELG